MKDKGSIYISGAISGMNYENVVDKFAKAEKTLTEKGYEVFNPINNGLDKNFSWEQHMAVDLAVLMECEAIYLLNDVWKSRGARIEASIALERGMLVMFEDRNEMILFTKEGKLPLYLRSLLLLLIQKSYTDEQDPSGAKRSLLEFMIRPICQCPPTLHVFFKEEINPIDFRDGLSMLLEEKNEIKSAIAKRFQSVEEIKKIV